MRVVCIIFFTRLYFLLTIREDSPHLEIGGGEADDGRFVQLAGDGTGEGKHLGQLVKLGILLLPPSTGCILTFLLHGLHSGKKREKI